jgi:hypothetical protein
MTELLEKFPELHATRVAVAVLRRAHSAPHETTPHPPPFYYIWDKFINTSGCQVISFFKVFYFIYCVLHVQVSKAASECLALLLCDGKIRYSNVSRDTMVAEVFRGFPSSPPLPECHFRTQTSLLIHLQVHQLSNLFFNSVLYDLLTMSSYNK